ncbi:acyl-CoA dehydrogenase family protein [Mycobacterium xenopi 3993]|nr:acyl-CoA dehydrogenase family protein [Mycobacterium xenopi 3993]
MSHYKSNVRDQEFNLFEVFGVDKVFGEGPYSDLDVDTAREMLAEMSRLAEARSRSHSPKATVTRRFSTRKPTP